MPASDQSTAEPIPRPGALYTPESLLGEWRADDPLSYARTLDARQYVAAVVAGLRVPASPAVALERAVHDHAVTQLLYAAIRDRRVVAFMGSHRLARTTEGPYATVATISRALTAAGYLVVSGGGPGTMEAAHLGARLSRAPEHELVDALAELAAGPPFPEFDATMLVVDGSLNDDIVRAIHAWQRPAFAVAARYPARSSGASVGVPTWLYGHEPPTPFATAHAKYFENSIREDGLLAIAKSGVVFAPGAAGTLQEVFQDAAQNYYRSVDRTLSPMVFLDIDEFWTRIRPVRPLLTGLMDDEARRLLFFVDDAAAAVAAITTAP